MQAAVVDKTTYANQRRIRNGQLDVVPGAVWNDFVTTSQGRYSASDPNRLTDVSGIANVRVGSLVTASRGVGREIYVSAVDVARREVTLSNPLWDAPGVQTYTFRRFKYALDFSGFANLQRFTLQDVEILMGGRASGVLLPTDGLIMHFRDCFFTGPRNRAITSHGTGCQGMLIDRCQFLSDENQKRVQDRVSIAFNVNNNDTKIRNNRANKFRHFCVISGSGHIITGNHFFQGDNETLGQRSAGIVIARPQAKTVFSNNYVDNCYLEWTNEHDAEPAFANELSFGGLIVTSNIFFSSGVGSGYRMLHVKPYGPGHFINGMTISGNTFKTIRGQALSRVDTVDTTHAELDRGRFTDLAVHSNTFHAVSRQFQNPATVPITRSSPQSTWETDLGDVLPFGGEARVVQAVMPDGPIRTESNAVFTGFPYGEGRQGGGRQSVRVRWPQPVRGKVYVTARCDEPT